MSRLSSSSRLIASAIVSGALLAAVPTPSHADAGKDPVVAKINGKSYHHSDLIPIYQRLASQDTRLQQLSPDDPNLYPELVQQLVTGTLVVETAEQQKLDRDPEFKKRLSELRNTLLQNYYAEHIIKAAATEPKEAALYKQLQDKNEVLEVHARHIVLQTEDDAKAVIAQLDKGADFAKLAHDKSIDTSPDNGDLHWFTEAQMRPVVPELAQAAFALKKGEYSKTPVRTRFGWHVLQVLDTRPAPMADIKDQLAGSLARDAIRNEIIALRSKAKITAYGLDGKPMPLP
jgi:peptidyl-prolyl cis-trans isomerase C